MPEMTPRRRFRPALDLATGLLLAALVLVASLGPATFPLRAQASAAPPTASAPAAAPAPKKPFVVYLPREEARKADSPAAQTVPMAAQIDREMRARNTPMAVRVLTAVVAAIFGLVILIALRHRTRVCPRCFSRLVRLGDPADAAEDVPADSSQDPRPLMACLACGELGMIRAGLLFRSGGRCSACHRWTLASQYKVVEPSTYMMYGLVRVDEACACGHEATLLRSTPPNEAPPADWPIKH
ncbi:MAG TPA: hypothetical protein VN783_15790 [Thermoanaerobaculia bacterium]|nr:hypothetical protein [Thermoanaerobaculia bacterium]